MKQLSTVAQAAKQIRAILKKAYPEIKFRITSKQYSMGNSIDVRYTDGVKTSLIEDLIGHYQYGHFDGMTDCYNYTNRREDIPQTKYLHIQREISDSFMQSEFQRIKTYYASFENVTSLDEFVKIGTMNMTAREFIHRELRK